MTINEDKKKCKGGRKKGFLATIAALLLSCSVVLAQNYTAGVTNTDKPDLSMQKAVYRLQIIETNMLAMISGTNTDATAILQYQIANSNMLERLTNWFDRVFTTQGEAAKTNNLMVGMYASSNAVTAVTQGSIVAPRVDLQRRTVQANFDETTGAGLSKEISPMLPQTLGGDGTWELLSAVSTNTIGTWYDVGSYNSFTFTMCPPTTGAAPTNEVIFTDISLNSGTNFYCIATNTFTTTNVQMLQLHGKYKYIRMRADVTNLVYSVRGFAGYE